jgi:hypothetical protein
MECPDLLTSSWTMSCDGVGGNQRFTLDLNTVLQGDSYKDYTSKLLEESEWNALTPQEQPKYAVYKTGTNVINNLYGKYKDGFWETILGITTKSFLYYEVNLDKFEIDDSNYCNLSYRAGSYTPINHTYNVEAVAITNPKFVDEKNDKPTNESAYKDMSRSYSVGNNNGLAVNYYSIINDIDKQNETLGKIEATIEIIVDNTNPPTPRKRALILAKDYSAHDYYIKAVEHRYYDDFEIANLSLSLSPYKIADGIGVDYQFEPTLFPLNNIIKRPIYFENLMPTTATDLITNNKIDNIYLDFSFYDYDEELIARYVKKPSYYLSENNDSITFYIEAFDNFSFDKKAVANGSNYEIRDMPYGDSLGQVYKVSINVITTSEQLSLSDSLKLPEYAALSGHTIETTSIVTNKVIRKDPREILTFTIKI